MDNVASVLNDYCVCVCVFVLLSGVGVCGRDARLGRRHGSGLRSGLPLEHVPRTHQGLVMLWVCVRV
jgi:hypothetical protein